MRFGFLLKRGKPEAVELGRRLAARLIEMGQSIAASDADGVIHPATTVVPAERLGQSIDLLVVLGGDGTFLHGATLVADDGVPLLGINLGSLGFMTHYPLGEAIKAVEAASAGRLPIEERMRLRVTVLGDGGTRQEARRCALNDAVISQSNIARLLDLSAELNGSAVANYKADGLILSTPTGSTAYNLAAGGPILTPDLEAIVVTPICSHALTNRPVVMRGDARIVVTNVSSGTATLTIDGQWARELQPGEAVDVAKAERPLRTFKSPHAFFTILREKLAWGERG